MSYSKGQTGSGTKGYPVMPNTSVQGSRGPGALLGLAGPWIGVRVHKSGPQWPGAEPWMCWMERASMLRKLTKTAVLTGGSVGRGAMEHSKALSPMAAGREQNRDPKSRGPSTVWCTYHPQKKPGEILLDAGARKEGSFL